MNKFIEEVLEVLAQAHRMSEFADMTETAAFIKMAMISAQQQKTEEPELERKAG